MIWNGIPFHACIEFIYGYAMYYVEIYEQEVLQADNFLSYSNIFKLKQHVMVINYSN